MKKHWLSLSLASVAACIVLLGISNAGAQQPMDHSMNGMQHQAVVQNLKMGKKADIQLYEQTRVGDVVLPAGEYSVVHRVQGDDHFVQFRSTNDNRVVDEAKCQVEPLDKKINRTAIYSTMKDGTREITRIEIGGENVAHILM